MLAQDQCLSEMMLRICQLESCDIYFEEAAGKAHSTSRQYAAGYKREDVKDRSCVKEKLGSKGTQLGVDRLPYCIICNLTTLSTRPMESETQTKHRNLPPQKHCAAIACTEHHTNKHTRHRRFLNFSPM
jgi:hypothetical protein